MYSASTAKQSSKELMTPLVSGAIEISIMVNIAFEVLTKYSTRKKLRCMERKKQNDMYPRPQLSAQKNLNIQIIKLVSQ